MTVGDRYRRRSLGMRRPSSARGGSATVPCCATWGSGSGYRFWVERAAVVWPGGDDDGDAADDDADEVGDDGDEGALARKGRQGAQECARRRGSGRGSRRCSDQDLHVARPPRQVERRGAVRWDGKGQLERLRCHCGFAVRLQEGDRYNLARQP